MIIVKSMLRFSRSNGLRWNAVFNAPRRVATQISRVIEPDVSVWWTQERPGLYLLMANAQRDIPLNPPSMGDFFANTLQIKISIRLRKQ
jgi:hypothetical protein